MAFTYLSDDELQEIADAALAANLTAERDLLFRSLEMARVRAVLPLRGAPAMQIDSDLTRMNAIRRTTDGIVPLERWLSYAKRYLADAEANKLFDEAIDKILLLAGGGSAVAGNVVTDELKEKIIFDNDLVPYGFLRNGHEAGKSVGRIKVLPFANGAPKHTNGSHLPHLGTAWLLSDSLIMTNHHVVNARDADEPPAAEADLRLQGEHAVVEWDYVTEQVAAVKENCSELVAWDEALDYAVLKLAAASNRVPLRIRQEAFTVGYLSERIPVNIVQHPGGDPKQVGIRNNLVLRTTDTEVHYFTDTRAGSSGSPVLDDAWQVVGLHRASRRVEGVEYQGKSTAYVNIGSRIDAVLAHVAQHFPHVVI